MHQNTLDWSLNAKAQLPRRLRSHCSKLPARHAPAKSHSASSGTPSVTTGAAPSSSTARSAARSSSDSSCRAIFPAASAALTRGCGGRAHSAQQRANGKIVIQRLQARPSRPPARRQYEGVAAARTARRAPAATARRCRRRRPTAPPPAAESQTPRRRTAQSAPAQDKQGNFNCRNECACSRQGPRPDLLPTISQCNILVSVVTASVQDKQGSVIAERNGHSASMGLTQ